MTDYHTANRQRFLRQLKWMRVLHAAYAALVAVSVGATLAAVLTLFTRGH